ncbi:hypothetical protein EI42_03129 [Thermosporothrix hazakensis]|uniref:Uncharacterized protein n=1 Tax=Thermosporothrix hazakensis TaxID=644383 RepID=A0A326UEC4_THEHA|nr:hypothetical protein EI42_03129 [Thermosporothrix hazakensis]
MLFYFSRLIPTATVAFACGSRSTSKTRLPLKESAAAKLIVVVVLPLPPFLIATASNRAMIVYFFVCKPAYLFVSLAVRP